MIHFNLHYWLIVFQVCHFLPISADTIQYKLNVEYFIGSPDGVAKRILGINGQFPGPTIRAALGDTLVIKVTNNIQTQEATSFHWHGLEQFLSPFEDGPEGVTQCPIAKGVTMTYTFILLQAGTYWYHSHHSSQYSDGCWGALIVDNKPREVYSYDKELTITLNDWFHSPSEELTSWYLSVKSGGNQPIPDSVLINGKGIYPCAYARLRGVGCRSKGFLTLRVETGKLYRLRIINTSSALSYFFSIDGHKMEVVEVDGVDTVRVGAVDKLRISSAMRYSVLVQMNKTSSGNMFWIRVAAVTEHLIPANNINPFPEAFLNNSEAKAVLNYVPPRRVVNVGVKPRPNKAFEVAMQGRPETHTALDWANSSAISTFFEQRNEQFAKVVTNATQPPPNEEPRSRDAVVITSKKKLLPTTQTKTASVEVLLNPNDCRPYSGSRFAYANYDHLVTLNVNFFKDASGVVRSGFNGITYGVDPWPVIFKVLQNETIPRAANVIRTPLGQVVQLVLNNVNKGEHPFHLHGHTFWVVGEGNGVYDEIRDGPTLFLNGTRRDTTHVPPLSWTVLRYKADNPGPWLFHCHISWHLKSGLGAVFLEGEDVMRQIADRWVPAEARRICATFNSTGQNDI